MAVREIVLDTETTGMDPVRGDRIVEIGCVELVGHVPTGRTLHLYINPERDVPAEAAAVHGLTTEFLADKPTMAEVIDQYIDFVKDDMLVIHNAEFDVKFLNAELKKLGFPSINTRRVTDTLLMARQKFPGSPASLDALCRRFNIDLSARTLHGALLDSQLLAEVYLELMGGRQAGLTFAGEAATRMVDIGGVSAVPVSGNVRPARPHKANAAELEAHAAMVAKLKEPLWRQIEPEAAA